MKKKELVDLRKKSIKELKDIAWKKKTDAQKIRMKISGAKEKNLKAHKNLRAEIAKILTLVREKEIIERLEAENEKKEKENKK